MADISNLIDLINDLQNTDRALRIAALSTHATQKDRIFGMGIASDGSTIGSYSKKPTYVSNKRSPVKMTPKGKTGKTKFKDGTPHKSRYFERGYFEFRGQIGRQNSKVDLRLSGTLENDYNIDAKGNSYISGFSNRTNNNKAKGNEKRFNQDIFLLREKEANLFADIFADEIGKQI